MIDNRVIGDEDGRTTVRNNLNEPSGPAGHPELLNARKASLAVLQEQKRIRKEMDDRLTPAKAIRAKCMDCAFTSHEVRWCPVSDCALWQWRFGRKPETTMRKEPEFLDADFVKRGPGGES